MMCAVATALAISRDNQTDDVKHPLGMIVAVALTADALKETPKNQIKTATLSALVFVKDTLCHMGWTMAK